MILCQSVAKTSTPPPPPLCSRNRPKQKTEKNPGKTNINKTKTKLDIRTIEKTENVRSVCCTAGCALVIQRNSSINHKKKRILERIKQTKLLNQYSKI